DGRGDERSGERYSRGQTSIFIALVARQTDRCVREARRGPRMGAGTRERVEGAGGELHARSADKGIVFFSTVAGHVPAVSQGSEGAAAVAAGTAHGADGLHGSRLEI